MHSFRFGKAADYLLTQTQSKDRQRARRAIGWLGDSCNHQMPAYPKLLKSLVPFLSSDDKEIRRIAADALATYAGEDVVRNLIPLLGDEQKIIVTEVSYKLLRQRDTKMLRRLLSSAAANGVNDTVQKKAAELLKRLLKSQR